MAFYNYVRKLYGAGLGATDIALQPFQTLPKFDGFTSPTYMVRGSFKPQAPGFVKMGQDFQPVSLVGNGINMQGQLALQRLAQLQKGSEG